MKAAETQKLLSAVQHTELVSKDVTYLDDRKKNT